MRNSDHAAAQRRWQERRRLRLELQPVTCGCGRTFAHRGLLTIHERSHAVDVEADFWLKVDRSAGTDGCWPWTGGTQSAGYGLHSLPKANGGQRTTAHRFALEITIGRSLATSEDACHRCDNRICCNPAHLFAGSRSDNMRDAAAKGRLNPQTHPERYRGRTRRLVSG